MRTNFDFGPLFRSTVGFDRVFEALRNAARIEQLDNYPPYDIETTGEDEYRVTLAVAGFGPEELTVTAHQNMLVVSGERRERNGENGQRQFLHRGLAMRAFERRFQLADHMKVVGANLADGLLTIELRREVPEAVRPRRIEIGTEPVSGQRQIEAERRDTRQAA
ncbi:MAG TPA: Hsp20 family protein [Acetobacteraceae bacterium]|nr:Hsp20 family protein [Acetobacteraceae bacterium]